MARWIQSHLNSLQRLVALERTHFDATDALIALVSGDG